MRLLHTSDWHLGQNFINQSREKEQRAFLDWLVETIVQKRIDVLVVAGDIFDTYNPPLFAEELYYRFLASSSILKKAIFVAGNHDSVAKLNTAKPLLQAFSHIHIVTDKEEIIPLEWDGKLQGIVCAVPYLSAQMVRKSVQNESFSEQEEALVQGIKRVYEKAYRQAKAIDSSVPIIATGHLTVRGCEKNGSKYDNYVGTLQELSYEFLVPFDYCALGHIHKSEHIGANIYYSGSPIHLSFEEFARGDRKCVHIVDFAADEVVQVEVPSFRKMAVIEGEKQEVLEQIQHLPADKELWLQILLKEKLTQSDIEQIRQEAKKVQLLALKFQTQSVVEELEEYASLESITPLDIFAKRIKHEKIDTHTKEELMKLFSKITQEVIYENNGH